MKEMKYLRDLEKKNMKKNEILKRTEKGTWKKLMLKKERKKTNKLKYEKNKLKKEIQHLPEPEKETKIQNKRKILWENQKDKHEK